MRSVLCAVALLLLSAAPPQTVEKFEGKVIALADGDTITVLRDKSQVKIRLEGIDAPEKNQAFGSTHTNGRVPRLSKEVALWV